MPATERVVMMNGTSRGLGLEMARCLARRQVPLIVTARDDRALQEAIINGYLWHEFGDVHLVV